MTKPSQCWNCKEQIVATDLLCPFCSKIQPPAQIDFFARLNMPHDFDLGIKKLEVAYFSLQTKLHPDRFANKSEQEKLFSLQQSMILNEVYETLKSPLSRAEYMLKLKGILVNTDNATVKPSQGLLMESLEAREKLAEANTPEARRQMTIEAVENKLSCIEDIKNNFTHETLEEAAQNTIRLRYLEKLIEEVKQVSGVRF